MSKYDLAFDMFEDIPEDLRNFLGVKFGDFTELTKPTTAEEATIVMGEMCVEVQNNMLVPLSGLPLVDVMMYLGTLNPVIISGMFAGLEALESSGPFDVIAPKDGGIYPGFFDAWTVRAPNVESVSVAVGEDSFDMTQNDGIWSAKWPMPIGDHTAVIFSGDKSISVSFSVVGYEALEPIITPVDEETQEVEFRFKLPEGSGLESGEITVTTDSGDVVTTILLVTETIAAGVALLTVGAPVATVAGVLAFASGATLAINHIFDL